MMIISFLMQFHAISVISWPLGSFEKLNNIPINLGADYLQRRHKYFSRPGPIYSLGIVTLATFGNQEASS